jgi:hypothetical protein
VVGGALRQRAEATCTQGVADAFGEGRCQWRTSEATTRMVMGVIRDSVMPGKMLLNVRYRLGGCAGAQGVAFRFLGEVGEHSPCGRPHQPFFHFPPASGVQVSEELHLAGRESRNRQTVPVDQTIVS